MYEIIAQELIEAKAKKRFIGTRARCRFCGNTNQSDLDQKQMPTPSQKHLGIKSFFLWMNVNPAMESSLTTKTHCVKLLAPFLPSEVLKEKKG